MNQREFYTKHYARAEANLPVESYRLRKVVEILKGRRACHVLDIGFGDGTFTAVLSDVLQAEKAFGIDLAPTTPDMLREKGVTGITVDVGSEVFPFEDGFFQVVFAGEIIEHLYDTDHLLDEVRRVLAPGGLFVLTTPNMASWYNRVALLLGFQPSMTQVSLRHNVGKLAHEGPSGGAHIRVFTLRALKALLRIHQFRILGLYGAPYGPMESHWFFRFPSYLERFLPSFASHVILVGQLDAGDKVGFQINQ